MRHGAKSFPNILSHFYGSPWAITPEKLAELHRVLWTRLEKGDGAELVQLEQQAAKTTQSGGRISPASSSPPGAFDDGSPVTASSKDSEDLYQTVGSVAIIRIGGTISSRASMFDDWSGGTSHEGIGRATNAALADGKIESIVYDVDSPGGVVYGQPENGAKVLDARKTKPTTAVANHMAASAAYWYLTQAAEVAVTPSGMVGCIGVIMRNVDETEMLKMMGVKDVLVSNSSSPYKTEGYPQVPFTEEARADMQKTCDAYAEMFVNAVAKGRGIRPATVERDFGRGRMLMAQEALDARMVDKIDTLENIVNGANESKTRATRRRVAADLAKRGLPTAKR